MQKLKKKWNFLFSDQLELILNRVQWELHNPIPLTNFYYCRYRYICDGSSEAPDVPAQANPEQEISIEPTLEETTFQSDSSLKNQLQSNTVQTNLTKVHPNFGRPESLQDFYIPKG